MQISNTQISGRDFRSELVIDITEVISQMLKNIMQNEITREATGTLEVGSDFLPTEENTKVILEILNYFIVLTLICSILVGLMKQ